MGAAIALAVDLDRTIATATPAADPATSVEFAARRLGGYHDFVARQPTVPVDATVEDLDRSLANGGPTRSGPAYIGRFRIVRKIGEGGMGRVYEAEDPELRAIADGYAKYIAGRS